MKDFLDTADLSPNLVTELLDSAERFLPLTTVPEAIRTQWQGKHLVTLFSEASTRTRTSFELAAKRLGLKVVNIVVGMSSLAKGETLRDTILTLDAMQPDVVVVRHAVAGVPHFMARFSRAHVINAGDGEHEHPTQALLDAFTLRRHFGRLAGLQIAILGDIRHSRVARSNVRLLAMMGAHVRLGGPRTLRAPGIEQFAAGWPGTVCVADTLRVAIADADAVMVLRIQQERLDGAFSLPWANTSPTSDSPVSDWPGPNPRPSCSIRDPSTGKSKLLPMWPTVCSPSSRRRSRTASPCAWRCWSGC